MIREIKFRGIDTMSGEMVYGDLVQQGLTDGSITTAIVQTYATYDVKPETVGQYTGLRDCNGKEIYEGDILKVYFNGKSKVFGVVRFAESRFYIDDEFMKDYLKAKAPMSEMFSHYQFEVIGNIYDDRRLLKNDASA